MKSRVTALAALVAACSSTKQHEVVFVEARPSQPVVAAQSSGDQVFFEFQVEKPVGPVPGQRGPRYPVDLRNAGVEGEVLAQFVVDTSGVAVMDTFKVLRSSHGEFSQSVKVFVAGARYTPALIGGRKVRQLVQQPFNFTLPK